MALAAKIIIGIVAFIHLYIMWLEMFAWTTRARKVFRQFPEDLFERTKVLAANQGLYNGFLAAGLIWSFLISDVVWQHHVAMFFLGCVAAAGLYGTFTASRRIFFVQALPALIGMLLLLLQQ